MPYHPNRSTHRALAALSQGPMAWEDLIAAIDPEKVGKACAKALRLKSERLMTQAGPMCAITALGADVLEILDGGKEYPPTYQSVRIFVQQGRAA